MIPALDYTRALLDTPPPEPIPGQLAVAAEPAAEQPDPEHDEQRLVHHQPSLWSL